MFPMVAEVQLRIEEDFADDEQHQKISMRP
jgi:hypothetical protein